MSDGSESKVSRFFKGVEPTVAHRRVLRTNHSTVVAHDANLRFDVVVEKLRFVTYLAFWFMCLFAITMTKLVTSKVLEAGPEVEGNTCPPFDQGVGFKIDENSHLLRKFGFNNICVNWDYTPSRELTAMVYPIFEYLLLIYVTMDFLNSWIAYKKGYVSATFFRMHCVFYPVMIILCAWFRMIFVVLAYVNVQGHTAGFLGLQIALIMVALYNAAYALETKVVYKIFGTHQRTRIAVWAYLIGDLLISAVKVYLSAYVVFLGSYPDWAKSRWGSKGVGQWVDVVWMIFNAVLPVFISYIQAANEQPLVITIDQAPPVFISKEEADRVGGATAEETTPLQAERP